MSNTTAPKKHILLATTGASPQVVTETLFAIHEQNLPWPEEIQIITTAFGKKKAEAGLFSEAHLQRMCEEIGKPVFQPEQVKILVVPDANGVEVEDARSLEDHEALANFITTKVRDLTADENNVIHASLAGGRKTMTFYLGYAMSLFGRSCDVLSHVLVSELYETLPGFWYPSKTQAPLYTRDNKQLSPADATVTLAEIPFIRHRHELPTVLANESESDINFRKLVRLINLGDSPEDLHLEINLQTKKITVSDLKKNSPIEPVVIDALQKNSGPKKFNAMELIFFACIARQPEDKKVIRPADDKSTDAERLFELIMAEMHNITGNANGDKKVTLDAFEDDLNISSKSLAYFKGNAAKELDKNWFDQHKTRLKAKLSESLPAKVVERLVPTQIDEEENSTRKAGYAIPLARTNIRLVNANGSVAE